MNDALAIALPLIKRFEGLRLKAYLCPAGKWTIGWGHTGPEVCNGLEINTQQAERLLALDTGTVQAAVRHLVVTSINTHQEAVLISFAFNLGTGALASSTLLQYVNSGAYQKVPEELLKWVHVRNPKTGQKAPVRGLQLRRADEAALWVRPVEAPAPPVEAPPAPKLPTIVEAPDAPPSAPEAPWGAILGVTRKLLVAWMKNR